MITYDMKKNAIIIKDEGHPLDPIDHADIYREVYIEASIDALLNQTLFDVPIRRIK